LEIFIILLFIVIIFLTYNTVINSKKINQIKSEVDSLSKNLDEIIKIINNRLNGHNKWMLFLDKNDKKNYESYEKNNIEVNKKIKEITQKIDGIAEWFSLPQSISKDEKEKYNISIEKYSEDYNNLSTRGFKEKYVNYKVLGLENAELLRANKNLQPNFGEMALGKYVAVEINNSIYSVYLHKELNLYDDIFDGIGISFIFELDIEPLKGFTYSKWKLTKPAVFQQMNNNRWICIEKGKIFLDQDNLKQKDVIIENINNEDNSIIDNDILIIVEEDNIIENNLNKSTKEENKTNLIDDFWGHFAKKDKSQKTKKSNNKEVSKKKLNNDIYSKELLEKICEEHSSFSSKYFGEHYTNLKKLNYTNGKFTLSNLKNGYFIAINPFEDENENYLVFYTKNSPISKNSKINSIFDFDETFDIYNEDEKVKNWKIKPAILKLENNNFKLINKGDITLIVI